MIDVLTAAGLSKLDIRIPGDPFLAEVLGLKHKNVAADPATLFKKEIEPPSPAGVGRKRWK